MFIGEYYYNIDQKKRISLPITFRKALGKKFIITRGLDKCLFVYTIQEWKNVTNKLNHLPFSQSDARGFTRIMLTGAMEINIDSLGRMLVPDFLKEYANLSKKVVVTGVYNRIEVWDEKTWKEYRKEVEEKFENIADKINL